MRHYFGSNSAMQTLELMYLNDQIREMREGRPPRRRPQNDVGPGCLLKFMGLAVVIVLMVLRMGHTGSDASHSGAAVREQSQLQQAAPELSKPTAASATQAGDSPKCGSPPAVVSSPAVPIPSGRSMRIWTDASGKYHVEAMLVEFGDDKVCLKTTDGRNVQVAMGRLSKTDRDYVHTFSKTVSCP